MPQHNGAFVNIFGQFHADDKKWEIALTNADRRVSIVVGKAGQSFEQVLGVAKGGLDVAEQAAA